MVQIWQSFQPGFKPGVITQQFCQISLYKCYHYYESLQNHYSYYYIFLTYLLPILLRIILCYCTSLLHSLLRIIRIEKYVIMESLLHIITLVCFCYNDIITHYYHYYPLLQIWDKATCRWCCAGPCGLPYRLPPHESTKLDVPCPPARALSSATFGDLVLPPPTPSAAEGQRTEGCLPSRSGRRVTPPGQPALFPPSLGLLCSFSPSLAAGSDREAAGSDLAAGSDREGAGSSSLVLSSALRNSVLRFAISSCAKIA